MPGLPFPLEFSIMPVAIQDKRRLSLAFFSNLLAPMALRRKLRLVRGNNLTKIRRLRGCCGNYGEPGC